MMWMRQLWRLSENLHRAELTKLEYDKQVVRYAELLKAKQAGETAAQECEIGLVPEGDKVAPSWRSFDADGISRQVGAKVGRPESGNRLVARELNIPEAAVRRAYQTASLSPEAQEAAVDMGLDDNRSALLEAAKANSPKAQAAIIRGIAERKTWPPSRQPAKLRAAPQQTAKPLRDLVGISGGELARWIKITTPNDRPHVIRVLETAASILRDELEARNVA